MPNSLISEKSPYLLQHAHNPVDWHPWSEEAFEQALQEDKPVFLSIGYSTCHWCHVMAHESFEDAQVAKLINDAFVPVKVDREERPDIDQIYMTACQMMTGRGGWPLTIIMTPDKKPFFAATYIPKEGRFGSSGLLELIPRIIDLWTNDRARLLDSAEKISVNLNQLRAPQSGTALDESTLTNAYEGFCQLFDLQNGGFGSAPKFPTPHNLLFLLRYWKRTGDANALDMVETTLQAMRIGGVYDHVGFGFHRYSTDARWFVPHFEKMLYDQALLAMAYSEAYQATHKVECANTAREILDYVLRDMTSEDGGFYSAEDADSEGVEGKFYLWSVAELKALLDKDEFSLVMKLFDIQEGGNFEIERGMNILAMRSSLEDAASVYGIPEKEIRERLSGIRTKLFAAREKRVRPYKDDKILTDWNGLMIAAYAKAAQVLGQPVPGQPVPGDQGLSDQDYSLAARRAADFILAKMRGPDGRLLHRYRDGPGIQANLDDYSFMIWGLIELYEAVFDTRYLQAALDLTKIMIDHFWDNESGGFYFTPDDGERLLVRHKEIYDGAVPSGNSVAMLNLLRLSRLTGNHEYEELADKIGWAFSAQVNRQPAAYAMLMATLDFGIGPAYEVVMVGDPDAQDTIEMLKALSSRFLPSKVMILVDSGEETPAIIRLAGFTKNLSSIKGAATAYVCANHACDLPTTDAARMLDLLGP
ncbi:MAG: thioredoxin domain-containing protein [Methanotrichaceae archaeon]|jgi:uncharacterized protein YyaL (SSP411 family)